MEILEEQGKFGGIVRPIHGVMYLLLVFIHIKKVFAWKILFVDAIIGLIFWLNQHYLNIV